MKTSIIGYPKIGDDAEIKLTEDVKKRFAFAKEKLGELADLRKGDAK